MKKAGEFLINLWKLHKFSPDAPFFLIFWDGPPFKAIFFSPGPLPNLTILSAIKNKWKISPTGRQKQTQKQNWYDNEENLSNAALHERIFENKFQPPTNENWIISYGVEPSEIQKLYKWPFSVTEDTKLIMFQFKINHNIIYTKDKLKEPT